MADFKCEACGASFPSEEALKSHAKMKVTQESQHFAKMNAGRLDLNFSAGESEKPR